MDSVTHHLRFGIGPWTGSFCSALVHYSVKRRTNPFLAPAGERGGFVFSLACFLEKGPALSNTRQGRECLSISRRSATVRLCRRKIALPRYQFGLNLSAFQPDIYVASGCLGHRSPLRQGGAALSWNMVYFGGEMLSSRKGTGFGMCSRRAMLRDIN